MNQQQQQQQQQQALMQQALLQQQSLYHPGLLAAPQVEPYLSGNLLPGVDPSTCRSVHPMALFTTMIADLLGWQYCLLMGGTCLGSPSKLIGHIQAVSETVSQTDYEVDLITTLTKLSC
ncbi:hypothetical protein RND81_11G095400 [Saponaria officinalis]|uniref:Uncharacterized protein n=1 Tax=Saponaria officinalis TaxID=3572 RepID=A0AAW1HJY0_SAPOF